MCLELFFAVNQLLDFIIISATARALRIFNLKRAALAATISALYALAPPALLGPAAQLAMLAVAARVLTGRANLAANIRVALSLAVCAAMSGAVSTRLGGASAGFTALTPVAAAAGAGIASGCARVQRRDSLLRPVRLRVECRGRRIELSAVVDTGNRLKEPLSGLPVLIADRKALAGLPRGLRTRSVAYGAIGCSGRLACFHPDRIYIDAGSGMRRCPEAWIAIYEGRLPCAAPALAPADLVV